MSEKNVESVRRAWDAFNRGDLDAFFADAANDVEFEEDPAFPEAGTYRGRDEISGYIASFQEGMAEHRFEIEELRDLGDRVLRSCTRRAAERAVAPASTNAPRSCTSSAMA